MLKSARKLKKDGGMCPLTCPGRNGINLEARKYSFIRKRRQNPEMKKQRKIKLTSIMDVKEFVTVAGECDFDVNIFSII